MNRRRSGDGDLALKTSETLEIEALVAAQLEPQEPANLAAIKHGLNRWHLERARMGTTDTVPVELIINGCVADKTPQIADGEPRTISFKTPITRSSWIALRIFPSSHTHPVFAISGSP